MDKRLTSGFEQNMYYLMILKNIDFNCSVTFEIFLNIESCTLKNILETIFREI